MTLVRFVTAMFYTIAGILGFVWFICLKNYPGAVLAVVTGFISIINSHLHFLNYKNILQDWYSATHLLQISIFSFYAFAISTSILVYFGVMQILKQTPMIPFENNIIIPLVWAFMCMKSSFMLLYFSRRYSTREHSQLVEESVEADPQSAMIEP